MINIRVKILKNVFLQLINFSILHEIIQLYGAENWACFGVQLFYIN